MFDIARALLDQLAKSPVLVPVRGRQSRPKYRLWRGLNPQLGNGGTQATGFPGDEFAHVPTWSYPTWNDMDRSEVHVVG